MLMHSSSPEISELKNNHCIESHSDSYSHINTNYPRSLQTYAVC